MGLQTNRWSLPVAGAALYVASVFLTGCGLYWSNHSIQLPLVFELNEPDLFPDDAFVATLRNYAAPVWHGVALLGRLIPIEQTLVLLFLLERMLLILAGARLGGAMAPGSVPAMLFAMAFVAVAPQPLVGDGTIVTDNFEHTGLSVACFLMTASALLRHHRISAAIWFSAGFFANSMYGVYAATYLIPAWIVITKDRSERRKWLPALIMTALFCMPVFFWTVTAFSHGTADAQTWLMAAKIRFPHHFYPHTWEPQRWLALILLLVFIPFVLRLTMRQTAVFSRAQMLFSLNVAWSCAAFLWLAYAMLAAYVFAVPWMFVMHPARGADLWYCLAGISCLSMLGLRLERLNSSPRYAAMILLLSIAAVGLPAIAAVYQRSAAQQPLVLLQPRSEIQELAKWTRESTGRHSKFLVDPRWEIFRALSRRTNFVTWKDGSAILWNRSFVSEWAGRLRKLNFPIELHPDGTKHPERALGALYNVLTDEEAQALAQEFALDYWIIPIEKQTELPVVHHTRNFKIVRLGSTDRF